MITFRKSLAFRLFVSGVILLSFPLLVDTFVVLQKRYRESLGQAQLYLAQVTSLRTHLFSYLLEKRDDVTPLFTYFSHLQEAFSKGTTPHLNTELQRVAYVGNFSEVILFKAFEDGSYRAIAASLPDNESNSLESYHFYAEIVKSEAEHDQFRMLYDAASGDYYTIYGQKIKSVEGKAAGFLLFVRNVTDKIKPLIAQHTDGATINFALLLDNKIVVTAGDPQLQFQYFAPITAQDRERLKIEQPILEGHIAHQPLTVTQEEGFSPFFTFTFNGKEHVGYLEKITNTDFFILAYTSQGEVALSPFLKFRHLYFVYGFIFLIGGVVSLIAVWFVSRPLRSLGRVMEAIASGETTVRYKRDPIGLEINDLGNSFNEMIDALLEKTHLAEEERVKSEIFKRELRIGQQAQRRLLPTLMPSVLGVEIVERFIPAKLVGGDFYDIFTQENGKLILAIADASGKGVSACFYSLGVRSYFRVMASAKKHIGAIMEAVNALFLKDSGESGMFVTMLGAIYDPVTRKLQYASCGHTPLLVRRRNGQAFMLEDRTFALGIVDNLPLTEGEITLENGDIVVLYTDGITEAENGDGGFYTEAQLQSFVATLSDMSAAQVASAIMEDVGSFVGQFPQHDDMTLVVMKVTA